MAWAQWVRIYVENKTTNKSLHFKWPDSTKNWGWTFRPEDQNRGAISIPEIEQHEIKAQDTCGFGQSGTAGKTEGCSGTIEIRTMEPSNGEDTKICQIYYSCPAVGDSNSFDLTDVASGWRIDVLGQNIIGGALGSVFLEIRKL
ncbi:aegerolysin type hemolysin [Clohesyomyces aquaticus]|uniref:Aegerolysin type hemolysin n=1 Tax=Clohesyomyces aquaticus TaxID=1231657 RepID=A0A1Y1ZX60_9PLEO|nr:aegerolysin type hemolysin [Clohesyomyces aquaticus]